MKKKFFAEILAGFLIVFIGAGTAAIVAKSTLLFVLPVVGLGFFFAVMLVSQTVGHISGGHGNPSITIGHLVAGKIDMKTAFVYIVAQFIGATIGGLLIYLALTANGAYVPGAEGMQGVLGTNIIPQGMLSNAAIFETIITFVFVTIVLNVTDENNENNHRAPFIIGLALAMLVILANPITGGSLNAARSFGVAIFERGTALAQFPVFLVFPTIGGAIAGAVYALLNNEKTSTDM